MRILLAENDIAAKKTGVKILSAAGHDVFAVNNGMAVIKMIVEQFYPDVLMLDIHLPGLSGIEICDKVKSVEETSGIAVLLTVGKMESSSAVEGISSKADGFITKPFDAGKLVMTIEKLAERMNLSDTKVLPHFDVSRLNDPTYAPSPIDDALVQVAQNGEACDVCGYVNQQHTFACQRCDVPLPSSVPHTQRC